jgi:hypothetical protein
MTGDFEMAFWLMLFLGSGIPTHVGTFPTMDACQAAAAGAWHNGSPHFAPGFICVSAGTLDK